MAPTSDRVGRHGERLELHTFKLQGGTIIGSGTAGQLEGTFAILGGTGSYERARHVRRAPAPPGLRR
ncbi:MAG TPA: hypothetical protein VI056_06035 [Candidatus Limnocylindria bacterium]